MTMLRSGRYFISVTYQGQLLGDNTDKSITGQPGKSHRRFHARRTFPLPNPSGADVGTSRLSLRPLSAGLLK